jgi:energy-coupling factor transporter ATP-binding protein EcfA2
MPKISRIRIINFSYNGDKRLILDELFNLHQGEDTLISLKNGGGKSVLVQALMQPILPNQTLQKRKMSDFFIRKKQPAYILIEWKLDQGGGYLLTGIVMMNKESVSQDGEEESHAIRYFTFTVHYKLSDPMDIRHMELTTKEKNRVLVKGYQEAQRFLQGAKRKRGGSVSYFSDSERGDYKRHLESFNIHPDEWKTVLLRSHQDF